MHQVWGIFCGYGSGDNFGYFISKELCIESLELTYGADKVRVEESDRGCIAYCTKEATQEDLNHLKELHEQYPEYADWDGNWPRVNEYGIGTIRINTAPRKI